MMQPTRHTPVRFRRAGDRRAQIPLYRLLQLNPKRAVERAHHEATVHVDLRLRIKAVEPRAAEDEVEGTLALVCGR